MRDWLYLLLPCLVFAHSAAQESVPLAVVEGSVINGATKELIRKARVTLESTAAGHDSELVSITDEAGHFRLADVNPGTYILTAENVGFFGGGYSQVNPDDNQTLLKISAGDRVSNLTLPLFPTGKIVGRALDMDGDPVAGYEVVLWSRHGRRRHQQFSPGDETTTNQDGHYQFEGVMPGTYYVSAGKQSSGVAVRDILVDSEGRKTKLQDLWTFYPAALSLAQAQAVRITSGQAQSDVDIRIQRGALLTVKGRIAGVVDSISKFKVSASVEEGLGLTSNAAAVLPNGEFTLELPPGKHSLGLIELGPSGPKELGSSEVNLVDQDLSGIMITRFKPARVQVRVVMEEQDGILLTNGSVSLMPEHWDEQSGSTFSQYPPQNGIYVLEDVRPGNYHVWFNNAPGCYLKSVQSGARILDSNLVTVTEGASLDLLAVYSKHGARVDGLVDLSQDQVARSIRVVLLSQDAALPEVAKINFAQLDQSRHFSVEHLRPGKYLVLASEENDTEMWDSADFVKLLRSEGVEVEVQEDEQATVALKLIPKEMTIRIRQQLGI